MNVAGFPLNCCQGGGGGSPVIPSNYLYNISSVGATTQGTFPVYDGSNLGETSVSSQLQQTNLGITNERSKCSKHYNRNINGSKHNY